jgi:drug/metabolite transporter (DMT)-like permease
MALAMAIFGSIGIVAARTGLHSFELVFVRCVCGTLFLGAGWVMSGQIRRERWNRRELGLVLCCGLFLVLNWIFLFRAFETVPLTIAVSVYYLAPVLVLLFGSLVFRERLTPASVIAVATCFAGSTLVAGLGSHTPLHLLLSSGVVWAFLAAFFYAWFTLIGKGIQNLSPYAVSMLQTLLGVLVLPPFVHFRAFTGLHPANWLAVAVIGTVHTGLVYYLFFISVRHLPARLTSALVFLDPGVAILLDTWINGFRPTAAQALGIALIFAGLALSLFKHKPGSVKSAENGEKVREHREIQDKAQTEAAKKAPNNGTSLFCMPLRHCNGFSERYKKKLSSHPGKRYNGRKGKD